MSGGGVIGGVVGGVIDGYYGGLWRAEGGLWESYSDKRGWCYVRVFGRLWRVTNGVMGELCRGELKK